MGVRVRVCRGVLVFFVGGALNLQADPAAQEMEKKGVRHAAPGEPEGKEPLAGSGHTGSAGSAGSFSVDA